jgi:glyoxylase I family protein
MSQIKAIHHVSVIVSDTRQSLEFYQKVLGLSVDDSRPDLGYPGAWLTIGDQQLHLLELPNPDPVEDRPAHGGRDRHMAVSVHSLDALMDTLDKHDISYSISRSGRRALFCRDPDGNALECIEQ